MNKKCKNIIFVLISIGYVALNIIAQKVSNSMFNKVVFGITGILANVLLYKLIIYVAKTCKIKFKKHDVILLAIFLALSLGIYSFIIFYSNKIYIWDNALHYRNMQELLGFINKNLFSSYKELIKTGLIDDYGKFLLIFVYPFYSLFPGNIQWMNMCYFICGTIPVIILLYIFGLCILRNYDKKILDSSIYKIFLLFIIVIFPSLHESTILGRPDIIGLIFALSIILLTIEYNFDKKDIVRWIILFIITFVLIMIRRWYLYFVVSYYTCYVLVLIISTIMKKDKKLLFNRIINLMIFGISSIILMVILAFKLIKKVLSNNYSLLYSNWNRGGFLYEPLNQLVLIGILIMTLIVIGLIYSLYKKNNRKNSILLLSTYLLSMFLFTTVQTFEVHQALILMPFYMFCLFNTIYLALNNKKVINYIIRFVFIVFPLTTLILAICIEKKYNVAQIVKPIEIIYGNSSLYPVRRKDLKQIKEVNDYLNSHLGSKESAAIYAASDDYDSQYFINYPKPNINGKKISSNSYLYSEGFPLSALHSKYYVILEPIQEWVDVNKIGLLRNLIDIFYNDEYISKKFRMVKEIQLNDDVIAYIYERIVPLDEKEIDIYMELCEREYSDYKKLFYDRLVEEKKKIQKNNKKN